ncbi:MAG: Methyl-accepting chemotaxis protein CtpH [Syntrophaceae bacterium PtaU1.Bin231]|nr:MAG: Methyl-accepting chemotaxis protein CtpH [Syntrophaceae bacterium PtaU1.Bin231]
MKEPNTFFQDISIRRRVIITVGIFTVLTVVIGLYGVIAISETNSRLHRSVEEGQAMVRATDTARLAEVHFKMQVQEWKDLLLRGFDDDLYERHLRAFNDEDRRVSEYLATLADMAKTTGLSVPELASAVKNHERLGNAYREALKKFHQPDPLSARRVDRSVRGIDREPTEQIDAIVASIKAQADLRMKATETLAKTQLEAYKSFSAFLIFLVAAGVFFGIFNAWSITRDLPPEAETEKPEIEE